MLAPLGWDATEFHIKAASEHTINEKRYDLELQIFHNPRKAKKDKKGVDKGS